MAEFNNDNLLFMVEVNESPGEGLSALTVYSLEEGDVEFSIALIDLFWSEAKTYSVPCPPIDVDREGLDVILAMLDKVKADLEARFEAHSAPKAHKAC